MRTSARPFGIEVSDWMIQARWRAVWQVYEFICGAEENTTYERHCRAAACEVLADAEACRHLLELLKSEECGCGPPGADVPSAD